MDISFIEVAPDSHFPIQNLPFGIFSRAGESARVGVRIGDWVVDCARLARADLFTDLGLTESVLAQPTLNPLMRLGRPLWRALRARLQTLLDARNPILRDNEPLCRDALLPLDALRLHLPVAIGDYTDFYASKEHATNVGAMFRGRENALMPNWLYLPVGYHGRSSSIVLDKTPIIRPRGQVKPEGRDAPLFQLSAELDFELELGCFLGAGNALGHPMTTQTAADAIFGFVLLNDWSARDIQRWEYQPLGPFLSKNFATSISPWVVTAEALEPFRCMGPLQDPPPLPYLQTQGAHHYDIRLEVWLQSAQARAPEQICQTNARHLYWSFTQMITHHTISGCNLQVGDLLGSGTISGPEPHSYGSLLELAWRGERPIQLSNGETRAFLQDGDTLIIRGYCQGDGYRVGFGEVSGQVWGNSDAIV